MGQQYSSGPTTERPNLPSTYQQVIENMRYIQEELLPKVELLNKTIFDPDNDYGNSDIILDPNEIMRVVGISVVVDHINENTLPRDYERNVTYELKSVDAVGLSGMTGIELPLIMIRTIHMRNIDGITNYPTWQCSYGDIAMTMYFRKADSESAWGDWVPVIDLPRLLQQNQELMDQLSHRQFVQSDTEPGSDEQEVGDYWVQSIFPEGYFLQNVHNNTDIISVGASTIETFMFTDATTGDVTADGPSLNDFTLGDPEEEETPSTEEDPQPGDEDEGESGTPDTDDEGSNESEPEVYSEEGGSD